PVNQCGWPTSFHRTMTQVANADTIIGARDKLELTFNDRQYRLEQRADKCLVRSRRIGEPNYGYAREIDLLTGSHNLQILWNETGQGRTLEQFPFAYIVAEKIWAPVGE